MKIRLAWALAVALGWGGASPASGAYWLDDAATVYDAVNPSSQSHDVEQDTGEQAVAGPLALSAMTNGAGDGGANSTASLNINSSYGLLTAQFSGSASNSTLSGAVSGVTLDPNTPAASFSDQLTVISDFFPSGYTISMLIVQGLNADVITSSSATVSISATLQIVDLTDAYEQALILGPAMQDGFDDVQTATFMAHVGDQIELTGALYVNGVASAYEFSPAQVQQFEADAAAQTAIDVAAAFAAPPVGDAPADGFELAGYVADSGTVYPLEVPETHNALLGMLGLFSLARRRYKKEPPGITGRSSHSHSKVRQLGQLLNITNINTRQLHCKHILSDI